MKKQSNHLGKFIYIGAIVILLLLFFSFVLEKTQITNFYTKPSTEISSSPVITDIIDYSPATPTDNVEIENQKVDEPVDNSNNTDKNSPINVVLTAAGQDDVGGPVVVRALLTDVKNGTCDLKISKDSIIKSYSASVINTGTYYSCDGFDIPVSELNTGTWLINVTVTSDSRTGSAEQSTKVSM